MTELKTLKDFRVYRKPIFESTEKMKEGINWVCDELKAEAVKWIKDALKNKPIHQDELFIFMDFFNLTEEDLK